MRSTGIVRKLDNLGRLVIPKEIRTINKMEADDSVEIYTQGDMVILKKYSPGCDFCNNVEYREVDGVKICNKCIAKIKKLK